MYQLKFHKMMQAWLPGILKPAYCPLRGTALFFPTYERLWFEISGNKILCMTKSTTVKEGMQIENDISKRKAQLWHLKVYCVERPCIAQQVYCWAWFHLSTYMVPAAAAAPFPVQCCSGTVVQRFRKEPAWMFVFAEGSTLRFGLWQITMHKIETEGRNYTLFSCLKHGYLEYRCFVSDADS